MNLDYEAWRCPSRDKFPDGPSVFCPEEGCPARRGCARDHGWLPDPGGSEVLYREASGRRGVMADIVVPPHPHEMVCPRCGMVRHLPAGWQEILGSYEVRCLNNHEPVVMVETPGGEK